MYPIELRIKRVAKDHFTVTKVFPGPGNTATSQHKHMSYSDAVTWCKREYPTVPRIRD